MLVKIEPERFTFLKNNIETFHKKGFSPEVGARSTRQWSPILYLVPIVVTIPEFWAKIQKVWITVDVSPFDYLLVSHF